MSERLGNDCAVDEMAIVDIFTKLIFDAEVELDTMETALVELLCNYEQALQGGSRRDISEYLRAMAVDEMIRVVAVLKRQLEGHQAMLASLQLSGGDPLRH